jgi:hypothetical protein
MSKQAKLSSQDLTDFKLLLSDEVVQYPTMPTEPKEACETNKNMMIEGKDEDGKEYQAYCKNKKMVPASLKSKSDLRE